MGHWWEILSSILLSSPSVHVPLDMVHKCSILTLLSAHFLPVYCPHRSIMDPGKCISSCKASLLGWFQVWFEYPVYCINRCFALHTIQRSNKLCQDILGSICGFLLRTIDETGLLCLMLVTLASVLCRTSIHHNGQPFWYLVATLTSFRIELLII